MSLSVRLTGAALLLALSAGVTPATDPKDIDAAVKQGADFLRGRYKNGRPVGGTTDEGVGPVALAGLALLETGTPADDAAVRLIAAAVRDASFSETRTYQIALCLFFLDRLGDQGDQPVIQMLAVRLLAGQNAAGGWTYNCIDTVPAAEEKRLRAKIGMNQLVAGAPGAGPGAGKTTPPAGKAPAAHPGGAGRLHPEVEKHRHGLLVNGRSRAHLFDDNSNTQFGVLGVWIARKHGVPVEDALDRIEKRFLGSQTPTGGWPYSGLLGEGTPSMTCAGLLGLATAVGRREERRLKAEPHKKPELPKPAAAPGPEPGPTSTDPFFNPPKPGTQPESASKDPFFNPPPRPAEPTPAPAPKKPAAPAKHAHDARDKAVERALDNLAGALNGNRPPPGRMPPRRGGFGNRDMYFFWSLERVGVIFGRDRIGNVDWYQYGVDVILPFQNRDGSWSCDSYGPDVDTAFALLFLARSNLVRDLSAMVQGHPVGTELRAAGGVPAAPPTPQPKAETTPPAAPPTPQPKAETTPPAGVPVRPAPPVPQPKAGAAVSPAAPPAPAADESAKLAAELAKTPAAGWATALELVRDARGRDHTQALVLAIHQLDGDRKKDARHALAERLTRMSAETLRAMATSADPELRRGAVLACAMKDDRAHVPDLIGRLEADDDERVVRAARAGLKSLSGGQDFGPAAGAPAADRKSAADAWRAWWARQK